MTAVQRWIALFGACALFFVLMALYWILRSAIRRRHDHLVRRLLGDQAPAIRIKPRRAASGDTLGRVQLLLERGAVGLHPSAFIAVAAGAGLFAGLAGAIAANLAAAVVLAAATLVTIGAIVRLRADRRVQAVARQFPSVLEMIALGLRAGRSLEESIQVASEQIDPPLSLELMRCHEECSMGKPVEEALAQLGRRWEPVRGIGLFVEAVAVLKQTGGNLVEVLDSIRRHVRSQEAHDAKHRAMTAEGRFSGWILMALPLAALVIQVFLAPHQLSDMLGSGTGRLVLGTACVLWLTGIIWVMKLTRPARY